MKYWVRTLIILGWVWAFGLATVGQKYEIDHLFLLGRLCTSNRVLAITGPGTARSRAENNWYPWYPGYKTDC